MNILIVIRNIIPAFGYGGTERVMWYLGRELVGMGHKVTYLATPGSSSPFARVIPINDDIPLVQQIPDDVDVIHFNDHLPDGEIPRPYIITYHGNFLREPLDANAVFVSRNHAERYGSTQYVYNGMDWDDYGCVPLDNERRHFHFLGQVAWSQKNIRGALDVIRQVPGGRITVMGGKRLNLKHGLHFYTSRRARFVGMVGGEEKLDILRGSRGLLFPVRWYEPFGIAITESLYCGAPVFGTPYGSLPELVPPEVGFLSTSAQTLAQHINDDYHYTPRRCHEYARDCFNAHVMAEAYVDKYERVLAGQPLNVQRPTMVVPDRKHLEWH